MTNRALSSIAREYIRYRDSLMNDASRDLRDSEYYSELAECARKRAKLEQSYTFIAQAEHFEELAKSHISTAHSYMKSARRVHRALLREHYPNLKRVVDKYSNQNVQ